MDARTIFTVALGAQSPWKVSSVKLDSAANEILIDLSCDIMRWGCPACKALDQPIHDQVRWTWQHLHFFQFKTLLNASLPRVKCNCCGQVTPIETPWSCSGSVTTLQMDSLSLMLAKKLTFRGIARLIGTSENLLGQATNNPQEANWVGVLEGEASSFERVSLTESLARELDAQLESEARQKDELQREFLQQKIALEKAERELEQVRDQLNFRLTEGDARFDEACRQIESIQGELKLIHNSLSWKLTTPLRWLGRQVRLLREYGWQKRLEHLGTRLSTRGPQAEAIHKPKIPETKMHPPEILVIPLSPLAQRLRQDLARKMEDFQSES